MHAAQLFAVQIARRKYGPQGAAVPCNLVFDLAGLGATFEAFLGIPKGVTWQGERYRFTVRLS